MFKWVLSGEIDCRYCQDVNNIIAYSIWSGYAEWFFLIINQYSSLGSAIQPWH